MKGIKQDTIENQGNSAENNNKIPCTPQSTTLSEPAVNLSSFEEEKDKTLDDIFHERLKVVSGSHNAAIISGSSYANARTKSQQKGHVLDAASQTYIQDSFGITKGVVLTTADGLGHSFEEAENDSTAKVTRYGCEEFNQRVAKNIQENSSLQIDLLEAYKSVGIDSRAQASKLSREQYMDSKSAMVGTVVTYDNGEIQGSNINVGDALVVVLDGETFELKAQLPARVFYDTIEGKYNPFAIQRLDETTKNKTEGTIEYATFTAKPNDIIIQLTDGVYSAFKQKVKESKEKIFIHDINHPLYKDTQLAHDDLPELLKKQFKGKVNPSAFEIADFIAYQAFERDYNRRKDMLFIVQKLNEYNIITLPTERGGYKDNFNQSLLTWLKNNASIKDDLRQAITRYIESAAHDEEGEYTKKTKIWELFENIERKLVGHIGIGDCATVQAAKVPYLIDEIVRAQIESEENIKPNLSKIFEHYKHICKIDLSELNKARDRLIRETCVTDRSSPQCIALDRAECKPTYTVQQVVSAVNILKTEFKNQENIAKEILTSILGEITQRAEDKRWEVSFGGGTSVTLYKDGKNIEVKLPKGIKHLIDIIEGADNGTKTNSQVLDEVKEVVKKSLENNDNRFFSKRYDSTNEFYRTCVTLFNENANELILGQLKGNYLRPKH